jgi:hypothetical protein
MYFTPLCINAFVIVHSTLILYYLCNTIHILFIVYVTLPPGIGSIAVGNKYKYGKKITFKLFLMSCTL